MARFRLTHISDNGDTLVFSGNHPVLLNYHDLLNTKIEKWTDIKFNIFAGEGTLNGKLIEENTEIVMHGFRPKNEQKIYALTLGGWLPFSFLGDTTILADRNIIDRIKKITHGNSNDVLSATSWWMDFQKNSKLSINPLLYALEGKNRKAPSFEEFCDSIHEADKIINASSQNFQLISFSKESCIAVYKMVNQFHASMESEINFLCSFVPPLSKNHKVEELDGIEHKLNQEAAKLEITNRFSHIAILSLLYEDTSLGRKSHGRGVLKPKINYSREDAYNALSDLLNLEILLHMHRINDQVFFCTTDFELAAFWTALSIENFSYNSGEMKMKISLENLFSKRKQFKI